MLFCFREIIMTKSDTESTSGTGSIGDVESEEDQFEKRIENTGCSKEHYDLQVEISNCWQFQLQIWS